MVRSELYKYVMAIGRCILFPESKCVVVSTDKDRSKAAYDRFVKFANDYKYLSTANSNDNDMEIEFDNGSNIKCISSKPEPEVIRGRRASIKNWIYDPCEFLVDQKVLDEVLDKYTREDEG